MNMVIRVLAGVAVLAAGQAQAQIITTETSHFDIVTVDWGWGGPPVVLSDNGHSVVLSKVFTGSQYFMESDIDVTSFSDPYLGGTGNFDDVHDFDRWDFKVDPGYKITSMTIGGKANFEYVLGEVNAATAVTELPSAHYEVNLQAMGQTRSISDVSGAFSLPFEVEETGEFYAFLSYTMLLEVTGFTWQTNPGHHDFPPNYATNQTWARLNISDVTVTFEVAPVPEPATYAMLLGGLGLLGVAARRRRPG